jgi:hypothetical protein
MLAVLLCGYIVLITFFITRGHWRTDAVKHGVAQYVIVDPLTGQTQ